jgi:hypothetical protein
MRFQPFERAFLIRTHQPRVAGNVGCQDRRQPTLSAI